MSNKELALRLATVDSSIQVEKILKDEGYWDNINFWRPYGDQTNNIGIIRAQSNSAEGALVELLENSEDSILTLECMKYGVDPESNEAPKTREEATELFFDIKGGDLCSLDKNELERLNVENRISIILSGDTNSHKKQPTITIVDDGEGQTPNNMPHTILSLNKNNKIGIDFVQGRYNQGGSGVAEFCKEGLQLVICKRNEYASVDPNDTTKDMFGFTVIRKFDPDYLSSLLDYKTKNHEYRYLTDCHGNILTFEADSIDIVPKFTGNKKYYLPFEHGMFRKLYDYSGLHQAERIANDTPNYRINALLTDISWPISYRETRQFSIKNRDRDKNNIIPGLNYSIKEDNNNGRIHSLFNKQLNVDGSKFDVKICVYNETKDLANRIGNTKKRERDGVLFTDNGQVHGSLNKRLFNSSDVGLGYIADNLLVIVDCSKLSATPRSKLFSSNRENFKNTDFYNEVVEALKDLLKNDQDLRGVESYFKNKIMSATSTFDKDRFLNFLFKKVGFSKAIKDAKTKLKKDNKSNLVNGQSTTKVSSRGKGKPKKFLDNPTTFRIKHDGAKVIVQEGKQIRVNFATNAKDDFFTRKINPGSYILGAPLTFVSSSKMLLSHGDACLIIDTVRPLKAGDEFSCTLTVKSNACKLSSSFDVIIVKNVDDYIRNNKIANTRVNRHINPKIDEPFSTNRKNGASFYGSPSGIPPVDFVNVTKEKWGVWRDMDEDKAVCVLSSDGMVTVAINSDYKYLNLEKEEQNTKNGIISVYNAYVQNTMTMAFGLYGYYCNSDSSVIVEKMEEQLNSTAFSRLAMTSVNDMKARESSREYYYTK